MQPPVVMTVFEPSLRTLCPSKKIRWSCLLPITVGLLEMSEDHVAGEIIELPV